MKLARYEGARFRAGAATNVPRPWRRVIKPSSTRISIALGHRKPADPKTPGKFGFAGDPVAGRPVGDVDPQTVDQLPVKRPVGGKSERNEERASPRRAP